MKIYWIEMIYIVDFCLYIHLFFLMLGMEPRAVLDMCPAPELHPPNLQHFRSKRMSSTLNHNTLALAQISHPTQPKPFVRSESEVPL